MKALGISLVASDDVFALLLTLQLAFATTLMLLAVGFPLAWWLARTQTPIKPVIEAVVALPLVLPPTVIGFYILILLNPESPVGRFWVTVTGQSLTFSFWGLVVASFFYSLPFMIQPLQTGFERDAGKPMQLAYSYGVRPLKAFFTVAIPVAWRSVLTACVLTFAHTIGEFGVVLMVGGNIPGETRVVSIAIYEHVEATSYGQANMLSLILLGLSFTILFLVFLLNRQRGQYVGA